LVAQERHADKGKAVSASLSASPLGASLFCLISQGRAPRENAGKK
jgi:hypothetical protein